MSLLYHPAIKLGRVQCSNISDALVPEICLLMVIPLTSSGWPYISVLAYESTIKTLANLTDEWLETSPPNTGVIRALKGLIVCFLSCNWSLSHQLLTYVLLIFSEDSVTLGFASLVKYNMDFVPCTVSQSHTA